MLVLIVGIFGDRIFVSHFQFSSGYLIGDLSKAVSELVTAMGSGDETSSASEADADREPSSDKPN